MILKFSKYQGTGNDFIMLHQSDLEGNQLEEKQIQNLCDRHFGIGADGLIILKPMTGVDFYVDYYNADGSQSFCGNGARCSIQFAKDSGLIDRFTHFEAIDGEHSGEVLENGLVKLLMSDVSEIEEQDPNTYVLQTGSPHFVSFVNQLNDWNIIDFGKKVRYSDAYQKEGINVNLVEIRNNILHMLTYERGVENETLSCGTGVTAAALALAYQNSQNNHGLETIKTKGGELQVSWEKSAVGFKNIYLIGPAEKVYEGTIKI